MPLAESSLERMAKALKGNGEQVLRIGVRIADALSAAHDKGVIHRDVKPANVLIFGDEQEPKLADFGICYLLEADRITRTEAHTVGTDDFVAPELEGGGRSEDVSVTADVYSLGKTLYAAVSGGRVVPRERLDDPRFDLVQTLGDERLDHLTGVFRRMIAEQPSARYQTMSECGGQLQRAIDNIRRGIPYQRDMYDARESAAERSLRFMKEMDTLKGLRRSDCVEDALRESTDRARERAEAGLADDSHAMTGPASGPKPKALAIASASAEELLSVALTLVQNNELKALDEWLGLLSSVAHPDVQTASIAERWVLPVAATLAIHSVGALAFHRQRIDALKRIVHAQVHDPARWIYHQILGGSPGAVTPWVLQATAASEVIRRCASTLLPQLEASVTAVEGLVGLDAMLGVPEDVLTAWVKGELADIPTEDFPGFYYPAVGHWARELPRLFAARPALERDIAVIIFDHEPQVLQKRCAEVTLALARVVRRLAHEQSRSYHAWEFAEGSDWSKWCRGKAP
jgi:hypothetical protein